MNNILSNMLWLPKEGNTAGGKPLDRLRQDFTMYSTSYTGDSEEVRLYDETDDYFGLPRTKAANYKYQDKTTCPPMGWPSVDFKGGGYRPGQKEAIAAIFKSFRKTNGAMLEGKCGVGKCFLGLSIAAALNTTALVIVHKEDLSKQWQKDGKTFFPGVLHGHVQGNTWDYKDKHFVTATAQTLFSRKDRLPEDFVDRFGIVIYDEGHRYSARTFEQVLKMFPAKYRLAVSATWRRKDGLEDVWKQHVGKIEHSMETESLVGKYLQVPWKTSLTDKQFKRGRQMMNAAYLTAISESPEYNTWLAKTLGDAAASGRKILCLSDRRDQIALLYTLLKDHFSTGVYIGGKTDAERKAALKCDIILGTYGIFGEGTNCPALDTLLLATPRSDVEQVVGRIQRPAAGKKDLLIIDPIFQTPYQKGMSIARTKIYHKLGFKKK